MNILEIPSKYLFSLHDVTVQVLKYNDFVGENMFYDFLKVRS